MTETPLSTQQRRIWEIASAASGIKRLSAKEQAAIALAREVLPSNLNLTIQPSPERNLPLLILVKPHFRGETDEDNNGNRELKDQFRRAVEFIINPATPFDGSLEPHVLEAFSIAVTLAQRIPGLEIHLPPCLKFKPGVNWHISNKTEYGIYIARGWSPPSSFNEVLHPSDSNMITFGFKVKPPRGNDWTRITIQHCLHV